MDIDGIEQTNGRGGLPMVKVRTGLAEADIYLHGGHVTRFKPLSGEDVLFLSDRAVFADGQAIRGGIPICFPWFGNNRPTPDAPKHGFARTRLWQLVEARRDGEEAVVVLRLEDDAETRKQWPHRFRFDYAVRIGGELSVEATVTNLGDDGCAYELALHTYFNVADVRRVKLTGFAGGEYVDAIDGNQLKQQHSEPAIDGEVDRIYQAHTNAVTVDDGRRQLIVRKRGGNSTVLWNPHVAKAAAMSDMGDDEWRQFLCVESAAIGLHRVDLAGGGSHVTSLELSVG